MLATVTSEMSRSRPTGQHRPVLLEEVVEAVRPAPGGIVVDASVGAGGHAEALLRRMEPGGRLFGIDRDRAALALAASRLAEFGDRAVLVHGRYEDIVSILRGAGVYAVDGIVADLGVSSPQLDDPERGFSFRTDGPLDMRMDRDRGPTAADWLAAVDEDELRRVLHRYGEERLARQIARAVVAERRAEPIRTTRRLAEIVERVAGPRARRYRIHPATRTFQAVRIVINDEVEGLGRFVTDATSMIRPGGRLVVISFHSLEDRAVKLAMRALANRCTCPPALPVCGCGRENIVRIVTTKPIRPTEDELRDNPRSRSARLRIVERI